MKVIVIHRHIKQKSAQKPELISVHSWMAGESDRQRVFVCNPLYLPRIFPVRTGESSTSYGAHDVEQYGTLGRFIQNNVLLYVAIYKKPNNLNISLPFAIHFVDHPLH